jgi:hypothetical protein
MLVAESRKRPNLIKLEISKLLSQNHANSTCICDMHACFGETTLSGVAFRHLNGTHAACKTENEGSVARLCSILHDWSQSR